MRRVALPLTLLLAGVLAALGSAPAQAYPARPIRVIVPAQAGSTCDTLTRLIGQKLAERIGQGFVVDNRAGAGGILGMELTARAPADGYNIACGQGGNLVVVPHTYRKLPYDPLRDFAPIALLATNYLALTLHPSTPFRSVKELVAYAKAHPGKLAFASNGEGAFVHLTTEQFRFVAGFSYLHVPYKGIAQYTTELIAGRVDAVITAFTAVYPFVTSGKLRVIATTRPTRDPLYPDIPTMAETYPGFTAGGWFGFVGPAAMSKEAVALLNREINRAMSLPDMREKMIAYGLEVVTESPEFFGETIRSDYVKYGKIVRDIGFKPQ